jgi:hypothetical protein
MIARAWRDGWRRVGHAPAILAGVALATFAMALPFGLVLRGALATHLGRSQIAAGAADGAGYDWWQEFVSQATGLGTTFTPTILGFASTLDGVGSVLDGQREIAPIAALAAAYVLVWMFLSGGILDRYARQRPTRAHGFFSASGTYFFRFLRLGVLAGLAYWWLFAYVHPWLFTDVFRSLTRDLAVERTAFAWRAALYGAFGAALVFVNVVVDYAKVRAVVEDRRSMLGALLASWRFTAARPRRVFGLYACNASTFLVLVAAWAVLAPGVGGVGLRMWAAFAWGQAYLLARLAIKLHFLASETALFQASLAHATYAARPELAWPDSPSAELVRVERNG